MLAGVGSDSSWRACHKIIVKQLKGAAFFVGVGSKNSMKYTEYGYVTETEYQIYRYLERWLFMKRKKESESRGERTGR